MEWWGSARAISAKWHVSNLAVESLLPLRDADIIKRLAVNSHLD